MAIDKGFDLGWRWRVACAFSKGFFCICLHNRSKLYEIQWFRGEGIRTFTLPMGEFRLTLDGQLKARELWEEAGR